ncbi:PREDICTED: sodium channel modifier 1-like isoform X2 [Nelumbo nucifera]|uniref:Sodium channel modifier 1 n=1 Tax=Nelumbo nucifera TaxID=4432 RepID=A0A1U8ALQ1_NELNU|nr:PREDICTED: sodium channel modifier 1-like isoform X2 [Nelumbo nucifera]
MSVFGGDSWAREAQHRKRRVDDLLLQGVKHNKFNHDGSDVSSSYKKLSNGKFACLVCPNNPILDSPLMLSMHSKGARHIAAESRFKERELARQEEINKRIALSSDSLRACSATSSQQLKINNKPLIERTRKATSEMIYNQTLDQYATNEDYNTKFSKGGTSFFATKFPTVPTQRVESSLTVKSESSNSNKSGCETESSSMMPIHQKLELCERREKELKFTAAGWKRDCHGKWFKDENVEFDSDEEDPNVCLT